MKIGVISDTHLSGAKCELPEKLLAVLKDCDLILHAGDILEMCVLEELKKISKVEAVYGNMDGAKIKSLLKDKLILDIEGKKICLMHGYGHPDKLVAILKNEFSPINPDIIVFGHSHLPKNEYLDDVLFFNPGSATDTIFAPYRSYGIIKIEKGEIKAEIHRL